MESLIGNLWKLVSAKTTIVTLISGWIIIILAVYDRGFWQWNGHFVSDPVLFQLTVILNLPAVLMALPFLSTQSFMNQGNPLHDAFVFIITITIQWIIIGCIVTAVFFQRRENAV